VRIGELARRAGVKAATIRFYEMRGVLPEPERDASGYPRYDESALSRLRFVTRAREVGLSVDEIATLLRAALDGRVHCEEVGERLREHRDRLDTWIEQATRMRDALDRALDGPVEHADCEAGECPVLGRAVASIHLTGS
jgi:DNA-binding transcriptional MerR regulator